MNPLPFVLFFAFTFFITKLHAQNTEISLAKHRDQLVDVDSSMLAKSKGPLDEIDLSLPIHPFNFPVNRYKTRGTFTNADTITIGNKKILYVNFGYIPNEESVQAENPDLFFNIAFILDKEDNILDMMMNRKLATEVVSRNHPNYYGQGSFCSPYGKIDFVGFHSENGDAYSIINSRIFNLKIGTTVFIKTNGESTIRSWQLIDSEKIKAKEYKSYITQKVEEDQELNKFIERAP